MQAVDLNLATRPFRNDTLLWVAFLLSAALVAYASWWNVNSYLDHRVMLADLEQRQLNIGRRMDELKRRDSEALRRIDRFNLGEIGVRSDKANNVIRFKAFSWTRLFNLLQEIQPYDVQMTSIHPVFRGDAGRMRNQLEDPDQVPVSVEGIAKSLKDLLELERSLIGSPHFDRVDPEHYAVDDHTREVVFRMRFLYDPRVALEEQQVADAGVVADEHAPSATAAAERESATASADPVADAGDAAPSPATDEPASSVDPSGALASDKLKKIERRGRGRRGAEESQPPPSDAASDEEQAAAGEAVTPEISAADADADDEQEDR